MDGDPLLRETGMGSNVGTGKGDILSRPGIDGHLKRTRSESQ